MRCSTRHLRQQRCAAPANVTVRVVLPNGRRLGTPLPFCEDCADRTRQKMAEFDSTLTIEVAPLREAL